MLSFDLNAKIKKHISGDARNMLFLYDFFADDFCVLFALIAYAIQLHLVVYAFAGVIVSQAIQGILAGVEAAFAQLHHALMLIGFALLKLESPACHIPVKALICFHLFPS